MDKKGDIGDIFMYVGLFFILAIILLIVGKVALVIQENVSPQMASSNLGNETLQKLPLMPRIFDNVMFIIFIALIIGLIASVLMIDVHPLYFIAFIIGGILILLIGWIFSNAWGTISGTSSLANISSDMPKTNFFFSKLPLFSLIVLIITGIILYSKMRYGGREI